MHGEQNIKKLPPLFSRKYNPFSSTYYTIQSFEKSRFFTSCHGVNIPVRPESDVTPLKNLRSWETECSSRHCT